MVLVRPMVEREHFQTLTVALRAMGRATAQLVVVLAVIAALRREFLGDAPPGYPPLALGAFALAWLTLMATALRSALRAA